MSYLNSPRLTFSGQFQADPPTVNNDPTHFDNANFKPSYQDYETATDLNGWWNPDGTGSWRFLGCTITSVTYKDGTGTSDPNADPVIGMSIMDSGNRVAGKIVDLDSQQQMVSALWGLVVRIVSAGKELMKGEYETASFTNIWFNRSTDMKFDGAAGACYQSILKNITWDTDTSNSRYLKELKEASPGQLSIQFNVDRYNGNKSSPSFTLGRIAGSIGPSHISEPQHFVLGRQLVPVKPAPPAQSTSNYATAIVDEKLQALILDLGNALQAGKEGTEENIGSLAIAINKSPTGNKEYVKLGEINYLNSGWYMGSSGICTIPLSPKNLALANQYPLVVLSYATPHGNALTLPPVADMQVILTESAEYVCADKFVYYLNPDESCTVDFYATNLGKPLAGKSISLQQFNPYASPPPTPPAPVPPVTCVPAKAINFPASHTTGSNGKVSLTISAGDPGNPRKYIDGQVYAVSYNLSDQQFANCNQSNFISILVFSSVKESKINNPTWDDIQPIMQQYANLYPLMSKGIFNLANKEVVDSKAQILKLVFDKEKTDPNYMPATRDLSRDRQKMILNYLDGIIRKS